ncbi:hypothetical protein ACFL2H_01615 [Planctomycetota bacterium]
MNTLFDLVPWIKRQSIMDELTSRIAKRSQNAVWQRVEAHCMTMCPREARGFVRVRAAEVVGRELDVAIVGNDDIASVDRGPLLEAALERVVRSIIAHIRALHVQPVRHRRAA